jgi:hypothetical protein
VTLPRRGAALALTALLLTSACQSSPDNADAPAAPQPSVTGVTGAAPAGAVEAARVGAADGGCSLPVTFGIADSYTPETPDVSAAPELADLLKKGPMSLACEIDAKPAGHLGFLRVYTGAPGDLRTALTAFIGATAEAPAFTELPLGGAPALEVTYREKSPLDGAVTPERAFAVTTPRGVVTVSLDSVDEEEHQAILPAYELAKSSLALA